MNVVLSNREISTESIKDMVNGFDYIQKNCTKFSFEYLERIVPSHYEWFKGHEEFVMNQYLAHQKVCPAPIEIKPHFKNVERYLPLLLEDAELCDRYLGAFKGGYISDEIMEYCLIDKRIQKNIIICKDVTEYCNLLASDEGSGQMLLHYLGGYAQKSTNIDMTRLCRKAKDLMFRTNQNALFYFEPSLQIEYLKKTNLERVHIPANFKVSAEFSKAYCALISVDCKLNNKPLWAIEYWRDNKPELLVEILKKRTEFLFDTKRIEGNALQSLLNGGQLDIIKALGPLVGDLFFEPVMHVVGHYRGLRDFLSLFMEEEIYHVFEVIPYNADFDSDFAIAAMRSNAEPWAVELLTKVSVESLQKFKEHYPSDAVESILQKSLLQDGLGIAAPRNVMKL